MRSGINYLIKQHTRSQSKNIQKQMRNKVTDWETSVNHKLNNCGIFTALAQNMFLIESLVFFFMGEVNKKKLLHLFLSNVSCRDGLLSKNSSANYLSVMTICSVSPVNKFLLKIKDKETIHFVYSSNSINTMVLLQMLCDHPSREVHILAEWWVTGDEAK